MVLFASWCGIRGCFSCSFWPFINYVFGFYGGFFRLGVFCRVLYAQLCAQLYAQHVFVLIPCLHSGLFSVVFDLAAAGGVGWLSASCGYAVLCGCTAFFAPFPADLAYMNGAGALPRSRPFKSFKL